MGLARAVFLGSESLGTHYHILLSQISDSSNLESQVPVFISPSNRVAQLYPRHLAIPKEKGGTIIFLDNVFLPYLA
jgi:hypothetical protein